MGINCATTPAGKWKLEPHIPKSGSVAVVSRNGVCTRLTLRTYGQRAGNHRMGRRVGKETGYTHTVSQHCPSSLLAQAFPPPTPQKLTPQANPTRNWILKGQWHNGSSKVEPPGFTCPGHLEWIRVGKPRTVTPQVEIELLKVTVRLLFGL